jgi:hypothetical protein
MLTSGSIPALLCSGWGQCTLRISDLASESVPDMTSVKPGGHDRGYGGHKQFLNFDIQYKKSTAS